MSFILEITLFLLLISQCYAVILQYKSYIYKRERVEREIKHNFDNFFNMFKWEPHLTSLIAYSFQTKTFEHEKKFKDFILESSLYLLEFYVLSVYTRK